MKLMAPKNRLDSHSRCSIHQLRLDHSEEFDPTFVGILLLVASTLASFGKSRERVVQHLQHGRMIKREFFYWKRIKSCPKTKNIDATVPLPNDIRFNIIC